MENTLKNKIQKLPEKLKPTEKNTLKILKKALGIVFIVLGVIGLFLPFLQGILFIIIGLALLENKKVKGWLESLLRKLKLYPPKFKFLEKLFPDS